MDRKNFIERTAYQFNMKRRKQDIVELGDDIDEDALKQKDVFEFGIRLAVDGIDWENIKKI